MTPREYLIASSVAGLFSSGAFMDVGFDFQLWYAVLALNLLLFAWLGALRVRAGMWALAAVLALSGATGYAQGTDTPALFAKQFAGILASALYFSCLYQLAGDDVPLLFRRYVRAACFVAIAGIALIFVELPFEGALPRLQSFLPEPSMFALVTLPAAYYCLDRYRSAGTHGAALAVLGAGLLLSRSSVGYLGLLFGLGLFFARSFWRAVVLVGAMAFALYAASSDFRLRLDDTVRAAGNLTVEEANLSTFALASNTFVTARVLETHPLTGNGLGSHLLSHRSYIGDVPGVALFESMILHGRQTMDQLNAADANSLFLRLLSETGLIGLGLVIVFIARYRAAPGGEAGAINRAVLVYFFAKLLRAGHYFSPEQFFFVFAYCLTGRRAEASL
jgi:hypothetical protein